MRPFQTFYRFSLLAAAFVGVSSSQASEITFPVQTPPTNKYMAIDGDAIYHTVHYSNKVKLKVTSGEVFAVTNREIIVARRAITVEIQPQPTSGWSADKDTWTETRDFRQQNTDYSQSNNPVGYLGTNYDMVTFKNDDNQDPPDEEPIYQIEKITPYVRVADLQVDSLNLNPYGGVTGQDDEDAQENPQAGGSATGKIVLCNTAPYTSTSNKPGWADFTAAPGDRPSFPTMHLFLQSFPSGTQVRLLYNGSNPAQVTQNPDGSWVKPPGTLRVWTKDVRAARTVNDYIQPNTIYSLEDLQAKHAQVSDGHFVFYVEGVSSSIQTADQTVKVQVKTPGTGSWVDLDTVSFTMASCKLKAEVGTGNRKAEREVESNSLAFPADDSKYFVLPRKIGDMKISAQATQGSTLILPDKLKTKCKWFVRRNPGDAVSGSTPTITSTPQNPLEATMSTDAAGSFNVILYYDLNDNLQFNESEQIAVLNVVLVGIQITSSTVAVGTSYKTVIEDHDGSSSNVVLAVGREMEPCMNVTTDMELQGGGSDKKLGISKIHPGILQNETSFELILTYPGGHQGLGTLDPQGPVLDATSTTGDLSGSAIYLSTSQETKQGGNNTRVQAFDHVGKYIRKNFSNSPAVNQPDHVASSVNGQHFKTWLAMYSDDANKIYGLAGKFTWNVDNDFQYHGWVQGFLIWVGQTANAHSNDTVIATSGFPKTTDEENVILTPPMASNAQKVDYQ